MASTQSQGSKSTQTRCRTGIVVRGAPTGHLPPATPEFDDGANGWRRETPGLQGPQGPCHAGGLIMAILPRGREHRTPDHPIEPILLDRWSPRAMSGEPL